MSQLNFNLQGFWHHAARSVHACSLSRSPVQRTSSSFRPLANSSTNPQQAAIPTAAWKASCRQCGCIHRRGRQHATIVASAAASPAGSAAARLVKDPGSQEVASWADAVGIKAPKIALASFQGLRGMVATADIMEGEVYATLPRAAALLVAPSMRCPCPNFVDRSYWSKAPWFMKMAVLLLSEREKGGESAFSAYIAALPRSFDTPLHWSNAELAQLQYPPLVEEVGKQREEWGKHHKELAAAVLGGRKVKWEDFTWALECVRSRAFSGPYAGAPLKEKLRNAAMLSVAAFAYTQWTHMPLEQILNGAIAAVVFNILYDVLLSAKARWYALCPVIDFINHSSTSKDSVAFEYFYDQFVLTCAAPFTKGEQVFITYGLQSNDRLLQYYGFVEEANPLESFAIPDFRERCAAITGVDLRKDLESAERMNVEASREGFPKSALEAVQKQLQDCGAGDGDSRPPKAEQVLLQITDGVLSSLPTTIEQDEALLDPKNARLLEERQRLAVQFRLQKKRILASCAARLRGGAGK